MATNTKRQIDICFITDDPEYAAIAKQFYDGIENEKIVPYYRTFYRGSHVKSIAWYNGTNFGLLIGEDQNE